VLRDGSVDTFYRVKEANENGGIEALLHKSRRRPNLKNRMDSAVEDAVLAYAILDYSLVTAAAAAAGLGLLVGGSLTALLIWHSIFLLNVLHGIAVFVLGSVLMPRAGPETTRAGSISWAPYSNCDISGACCFRNRSSRKRQSTCAIGQPDRYHSHECDAQAVMAGRHTVKENPQPELCGRLCAALRY